MRRAFCLSLLFLVAACSDSKRGGGGEPTEAGMDPATEADSGEDLGDDLDPEQEEAEGDGDAAVKPSDERAASGGGTGGGGAERDAAAQDAGRDDAATRSDAGSQDAGSQDAGSQDAGSQDAGSQEGGSTTSDAGQDGGASTGSDAEVPCIDEQIARLGLFEAPATAVPTEEGTQPGTFLTHIDATAGAASGTAPVTQSFMYLRFTENGLEKVNIGDEAAFSSTGWHLAARRYLLRLNSGVSGPGNVRAARTAPGTTFEALTAVPADLSYRTEQYYTETCEFIADTGLGSAATALASFWQYPRGCVEMTNNVFVIELPNGRHLKFQVVSYYTQQNHDSCQATGQLAVQPSGAANLRIRWAFLD